MTTAELTMRGRRGEVVEAEAQRGWRAEGTSTRRNAGIGGIGRRIRIGSFAGGI